MTENLRIICSGISYQVKCKLDDKISYSELGWIYHTPQAELMVAQKQSLDVTAAMWNPSVTTQCTLLHY